MAAEAVETSYPTQQPPQHQDRQPVLEAKMTPSPAPHFKEGSISVNTCSATSFKDMPMAHEYSAASIL